MKIRIFRKVKIFSKRFLISALAFLVIFVMGGYIYLFNPFNKTAEAAWFDENWAYREIIDITNNGNAQTNYQIAVAIDTQTFISNSKLQSNCNDLRFTDINGKVLAYFLEYCSNTASKNSIVWVTIPSIAITPAEIYVYYGNPSAPAVSSFSSISTGIDLGDGGDGAITVNTGTININTTAIESGRPTCLSSTTCADGIAYKVDMSQATSLLPNTSNPAIMTLDTPTGIAAGDEVLLINLQGTSGDVASVGKYEFLRVSSVATKTITFTRKITNSYIGTTASNQKVVIQRVPNYSNVTIAVGGGTGSLTASAWEGLTTTPAAGAGYLTGIVAFRASGTVSIAATTSITVKGLGYRGGTGGAAGFNGGAAGESYDGSNGVGGSGASNGETYGGGRSGDGGSSSPNNGTVRGGGGGGGSDGSGNSSNGGGGGGGGGGAANGGGGGGGNADTGGTGGGGGNSGNNAKGGGGGGGCAGTTTSAGTGGNTNNAGTDANCSVTNGTGGEVGSSTTSASGGGGSSSTGSGGGGGGGGSYGSSTLTTLYLGSGGGGGGGGTSRAGVDGSIGGGITYITGATITVSGTIDGRGNASTKGTLAQQGSGGSGGAGPILLQGTTLTLGTTLVTSGGGTRSTGGTQIAGGGGGGNGTIRTDYSTLTGTVTTPSTANALPVSGAPSSETKGPVPSAYWKFDEGYGTTTTDSTSNKIAGTLAGTTKPTWQNFDQCVSGKCLFFDGSSSKITVATAINNIQTIAMWIRPNSVSSSALIDLDGGTHYATVSSGTISTTGFSQSTIYVNGLVSSTITANQWSYVVITTTDSSVNSTSSLTIGLSGSTYFKGFIDEVKIYNYKRTASQVLVDYNSRGSIAAASNNIGASANQPNALSNGLAGYWKEDETSSGASATDSSGNGTTLTDSGTVARVQGKFANGSDFESSSSQYQFAADNDALSITGSLTLSAWIKPESSSDTQNDIIGKWDNSSKESYLLAQRALKVRLYIDSSSNYIETTANQLTTGTWYHVTGVYNNTSQTAFIYINGLQVATTTTGTVPSSIGDDTDRFHIGGEQSSGTPANFYDGIIDEARIYNRALSSSDVQFLYNFAPGPVAYYNFEENTGTTLHDLSGNANDMTWHGTGTQHWMPGAIGAAGGFNGSDDYADVADNTALAFGTSDFTITARIKYPLNSFSASPLNAGVINKGGSTGAPANTWTIYAGNPITNLKYNDSVDAGGTFNVNYVFANKPTSGWHDIAVTRSGGTAYKFYFDGSLDGSTTAGATVNLTNTAALEFGRTSVGTPRSTQMGLDDVKIYNYARTQSQMEEDENAGHPNGGSPFGSEIGYWKFDEGYSTTAHDSSASNNSGTLTSMASPATSTSGWTNSGKFNKGLIFDGSNDYVTMTTDVTALKQTDAITLSAWINLTDTAGTYDIISKWTGTGSTSAYDLFTDSSGKLNMKISSSASAITTTTGNIALTAGTWYHVVGVYIPSTSVSLYINGVLNKQNTTSIPSALKSPSTVVNIGAENAGTNPFKGTIDEVKVYGEALTPDQVLIDYNRGSSEVLGSLSDNSSYQKQAANQEYCVPGDATSCASPLGRWDFEEGTGTTVNDTSGNANTGTLVVGGSGTQTTSQAAWQKGKIGGSLNFDGTDDNITFATTISGVKTVSFWTYPASNTASFIDLDGGTHYISASTGTVSATGFTSPTIYVNGVSAGTITANAWNHIEVTTGTSFNTTTSMLFGDANGTFLNGNIDNVRIFNYARSAAQVELDYNKGGPIAFYKFDECQGSTANDSSGNGNSGTITIGASGTQTAVGTCTDGNSANAWNNGVIGKLNYSLNFDGNDDYVACTDASCGGTSKLDIGTAASPLSFGAWIKTTASGTHIILSKKSSTAAGTNGYMLQTSSSNFGVCRISDGTTQVSPTDSNGTVNDGNWHFLMCVNDGSSLRLYIDGISRVNSSTASVSGSTDSTSDFRVANTGAGATLFSGQIDNVQVYNYGLTATQVKTLYNNGAASFAPSTGSP